MKNYNGIKALARELRFCDVDFSEISPHQGSTYRDKMVRTYFNTVTPELIIEMTDVIESQRDDQHQLLTDMHDFQRQVSNARYQRFVDMQRFNAAIDFAINQGTDAGVFLEDWREGDTSEWPEFVDIEKGTDND